MIHVTLPARIGITCSCNLVVTSKPSMTEAPRSRRGTIVEELPSTSEPHAAAARWNALADVVNEGWSAPQLRSLRSSLVQVQLEDEIRQLRQLRQPQVAALGTFMGVFVPCTCTIFGVVVFLRLGFVVGQAGALMALFLCGTSFLLCLLTTLSLCALISDGGDAAVLDDGRRGTQEPGVYCALRKSVGPEFGAALGSAFYLAFTVDVAFYTIGFAETIRAAVGVHSHVDVFPWNPPGTWVDTAIASVTLAMLAAICSQGVELQTRLSLVVLSAIVICISVSLACLMVPTDDPHSGRTALSLATLRNNSLPELTPYEGEPHPTLLLMFVLLFPGFTGTVPGPDEI